MRAHLEETDVDERIILKWNIKEWFARVWTEFNCQRSQQNFRFHTRRGILTKRTPIIF
jgi:hypothetical protein